MKREHEHMIAACAEDPPFEEVVHRAKLFLEGKKISVKTPPPERDVTLGINISSCDALSSSSLERYFGIALDSLILFKGKSVLLESSDFLEDLVLRLSEANKIIESYGIKVTVYLRDRDEDTSAKIYNTFATWCPRVSRELNVAISFDIAEDQIQFEHIMLNEHRRMAYGDMKARGAFASI